MQPEIPKVAQADHPQADSPTTGGSIPWLSQIMIDNICAKYALEDIENAERIVSELLRETPPSDDYHNEVADLLSRFAVVKRKIRCSMVG